MKYNDVLSKESILSYLDSSLKNIEIETFDTIGSTNTYLKDKTTKGLKEGHVVVALEQTAGRGRYNRKFFSPSGTGLYWSVLLYPTKFEASKAIKITTMAAVAVCEAIEALSDLKPEIKWVNDIYIDSKKVCGILTEGHVSTETLLLESAVLGVGLNIYTPEGGFPEDIKDIATALFTEPHFDMKNKLVATFLNRFFYYYNSENDKEYTDKYKQYSFVIGKNITIVSNGLERPATVLDIDDDCRLIVKNEDGETEFLSHGEIKIKDFLN